MHPLARITLLSFALGLSACAVHQPSDQTAPTTPAPVPQPSSQPAGKPLPDMPKRAPWRAPATLTALDRVLGSHPAAVVRADGTVVAFDAATVRAIIDTEGVEA